MPRKKSSGKKARGRKSDFTGKRLRLLQAFAPQWQQSIDANTQSDFYNKVTRIAIKYWGYQDNYSQELVDDTIDEDEPVEYSLEAEEDGDDDGDGDELSEEEVDRRAKIYTKLRAKLAQWYRRNYLHVPESTASDPVMINPFASLVPTNMPKTPRRLSELNMYMKIHYELRMKGEAERRLMMAQHEYEGTTEEERTERDLKLPVPLAIRLETARRFWETESAETKAAVRDEIEKEYEAEKEAWETKERVPKTPQEYHHQLQTAGQYLKPIIDAISHLMNVPVVLLMPVPIPEKNGEIECLSVHANKPAALESATWFREDPTGYEAAEKSLIAWAKTQFSTQERLRHALPDEYLRGMEDEVQAPVDSCPPSAERSRPLSRAHSAEPIDPPPPPSHPPSCPPSPPSHPPREQPASAEPSRLPSRAPSAAPTSSPQSPAGPTQSPPASPTPPPQRWPVCPPIRTPSPTPPPFRSPTPLVDINFPRRSPVLSVNTSISAPNAQGASPTSASPEQPTLDVSSWPQHAVDVYNYLLEEPTISPETGEKHGVDRGWGDQWMSCVRLFMEFQKVSGFPEDGDNYPSKGSLKPTEISYWQKIHRPWKDQPLRDKNLAEFSTEWWTWWKSLQPAARIFLGTDDKLLAPCLEMDWDKLRKPGRNGFVLIMLSLAWWGNFSATNDGWRQAVADVAASLRCLCDSSDSSSVSTSAPNGLKRKAAVLGSSSKNANTVSLRKPPKRMKAGALPEASGSSRRLHSRR